MDLQETMRELESLGSEQTRKTFLRHGAPEPLFGVKFGDLEKLRKRLKSNAGLAEALWDTGNADARMLATMVADAPAMSWAQLNAWARALNWHGLVDVFVKNVALRSQHARQAMETWLAEAGEMQARAGWQLLASLATKTEVLVDEELAPWLPRIEQGIHSAQNRVREAMNTALIAIGGRGGQLQEQALAVARRIGKVVVDHGDTACETPDAAEYIAKVVAHRQGMAGRAAALAQNAVASVRHAASDAAKRATAGAQSVATGAKSAVASARSVVSGAKDAVSSATHAVSDVAKSAVASARSVASVAAGKAPVGVKNGGARANGANGAAKKAPAKEATPAAAKKATAKKATPAAARKAGVKRATPATVKKAAGKKAAAKRATPATAKKAAGKRATPAAKKAAAKRATPAAAKKAKAPARGKSAAKQGARPRA